MTSTQIQETTNYMPIVRFFMENELEISEDGEDADFFVTAWQIVEENQIIAAAALAYREKEFILNGIAVSSELRKKEIGKSLLNKVVAEVIKRGGKKLYLVARAPEFFRRSGFVTIAQEGAPDFSDCPECPQYGSRCFPEIMVLDLKKGETNENNS